MEPNRILFKSFLSSPYYKGEYPTDDAIAFVLPLFKKVLSLHEAGLVGPFDNEDAIFVTEGVADIDETMAHAPTNALYRVQALFPRRDAGPFDTPERNTGPHPSYLSGYRSFEHDLGHHDPLTDIFCLGLVLASIALGLDLYDPEDKARLAKLRLHPTQQHPRIHPALGRLITEMTEPDRSRRSQEIGRASCRERV